MCDHFDADKFTVSTIVSVHHVLSRIYTFDKLWESHGNPLVSIHVPLIVNNLSEIPSSGEKSLGKR